MDRFVRAQNVERYCRLLDRVTEESDRKQITKLLTEERQKQKEAGDPLRWRPLMICITFTTSPIFPKPRHEASGSPLLKI
jgi:hypothetical protein